MSQTSTLETIGLLLRYRMLRIILIAAPGITAAVGVLTAREANTALAIAVHLATGIVISSVLFTAMSAIARRMADERSGLVRATEEHRSNARVRRLSIYDDNGLYSDWYFRLRVQEEIERGRRYGQEFSILVLKPGVAEEQTDSLETGFWFEEHVRPLIRKSDLVGLLRDGALAVLLPLQGSRAAGTVRRRMIKELALAKSQVGIATYPAHGDTSVTLIAAASRGTAFGHQKLAAAA